MGESINGKKSNRLFINLLPLLAFTSFCICYHIRFQCWGFYFDIWCTIVVQNESFMRKKKKGAWILVSCGCISIVVCVCVCVNPGPNPALWRTLLPGFCSISRRPSALLPALTLLQASSALFIFTHTHRLAQAHTHGHSLITARPTLHIMLTGRRSTPSHSHTQLLPLTLYAISDSPEVVYTLLSLSVLNCLLRLVWMVSPWDLAQWSQKCTEPKSSNIIHLSMTVCLSFPFSWPFSQPYPRSFSAVVLPRLVFSIHLPSFFSLLLQSASTSTKKRAES